MIVCWRTVRVPSDRREGFLSWIGENRRVREENGILFELVLEPSARRNPAKTLQPAQPQPTDDGDLIVITSWRSHDAFDAWIATPDRDRLTDSEVHRSVEYGPITRYSVMGGYLNLGGLSAVAATPKGSHEVGHTGECQRRSDRLPLAHQAIHRPRRGVPLRASG